MIDPKDDGVKHINIYSKGKTKLGKFLSNFTKAPFDHPEDGKFNSIEGYWYWLSAKDDTLRSTYGFQAKARGRELGGKDWIDTDEFKRKIKMAIRHKLHANPEMRTEFKASTLPFMHYYVYGGKVVEPKEGAWLIEFFRQLRDEDTFT